MKAMATGRLILVVNQFLLGSSEIWSLIVIIFWCRSVFISTITLKYPLAALISMI